MVDRIICSQLTFTPWPPGQLDLDCDHSLNDNQLKALMKEKCSVSKELN